MPLWIGHCGRLRTGGHTDIENILTIAFSRVNTYRGSRRANDRSGSDKRTMYAVVWQSAMTLARLMRGDRCKHGVLRAEPRVEAYATTTKGVAAIARPASRPPCGYGSMASRSRAPRIRDIHFAPGMIPISGILSSTSDFPRTAFGPTWSPATFATRTDLARPKNFRVLI
jgi:hypothetical protein